MPCEAACPRYEPGMPLPSVPSPVETSAKGTFGY